MAIINQDNLNSLMKHINSANSEFTSGMEGACKNFAEKTSEIWESEKAVKFASNLKAALDGVVKQYVDAINSTYNTLTTNVQNHNKKNDGSVKTAALELKSANVSAITEKIKSKFSNGDEGLKEGHKAEEVLTYYKTAADKIKEAMSSAQSSISQSKAFGDEEMASLSATVKKVFDNWKETEEKLYTELKSALQTVDTDESSMASTNKSNWGN